MSTSLTPTELLDEAGELLDTCLEDPRIWHLEFGRVVSEGHLHIQGADAAELAGRERRRWSFREVAAQMTVMARVNGDEERLAKLEQIAERLVGNAEEAGYEGQDAEGFAEVWRGLAFSGLEEMERSGRPPRGERSADEAVARLIPTPEIEVAETNADKVILRAEQSWINPAEVGDLFERWLPLAEGQAQSVDAVARFAMIADREWQVGTGLAWVERTIAGEYGQVANSCWFLADWLGKLRSEQQLPADAANRWRRIVDGLTAAGDERAAKLQQTEE